MDYRKIHDRIIVRAKLRTLPEGTYTELHHIRPKAIWPEWKNLKKHPWNGVELLPREHFIIHRLLAKIFPETSMVYAVWMMACLNDGEVKVTARTYEYLRKEVALRNGSEIEKRKKSEAAKGKPQTAEHVASRVSARKENGPWLSEDTKQKIKDARKRYTDSGKSWPLKGKKQQTVECPHCFKIGGISSMRQWHFDRCKKSNGVLP